MQVQIGSSNFGGQSGFQKRNTYYLSDKNNGNNIFRVLPPLHSLAAKGQYYKYWSVYQNFMDSNGKTRWFSSIEEFDAKTKTIRVVDPLAEKLKEYKAQQDMMKQAGATEEQLDGFYQNYIKPFTPSKKYYVNVITQDNQIGTLALPITAFQSLKALAAEYNQKNIDITGMRGIFLNFKRVQGARKVDVTYSVDVFRESVNMNGEMVEKAKVHELTQDIINRLGTETEDLVSLHVIPTAEDLQLLAIAPAEQRGLVVDRIVGRSDVTKKPEPTMNVAIPGTNAVAVPRVEQTSDGNLNVVLPSLSSPAQGVEGTYQTQQNYSAPPVTGPAPVNPGYQTAGYVAPGTMTSQTPTTHPSHTTKPSGTLSDAEFHNIFSQKAK
jgi:hypothetical protein